MAKATYVHWVVRFPLNFYSSVSSQIVNDCLLDTVHAGLPGHKFEDVSFTVQECCDKDRVLMNLVHELDKIANSKKFEIAHFFSCNKSTFGIDYKGNGILEYDKP